MSTLSHTEITDGEIDPFTTRNLPVAATPTPTGNPGLVGIPLTIAGAVGLGLANIGFFPAAAAGSILPTILTATAIGLLITTIWAAALGQNLSASLFGVFFGFYASYAALALGLINGWFGIAPADVQTAQVTWFLSWIITLVLLTITTLSFPWTYTLLLVLVDMALIVLLWGLVGSNTTVTYTGGVLVFLFIALASYLYVDAMEREAGKPGLPVGAPLRKV
ncbi:GPR1/FUN34/YaaH family transporter [Microbacterium kunmingense]|uniref:GPR1/FUN34/YaaH family transporter n=1 Tax=Microbacterium kunmingense TaxID=2915939 RepID=UPI002003665F|nr:GPR1/FUN34/YaaH family transporter [Microbacterium kunmingense]